jgi:orotate phosphoribosyltransferase
MTPAEPTSPRHAALASFLLERAIRFGEFTLASGARSDYYCDGKLVSFDGRGLALIADAILQEIDDLELDAIGGMDMGATPIVAGVSLRAHERGLMLPSFVVRKAVKGHGTKKVIEGPIPPAPARVAVVDDVITSGGSTKLAIERIREAGHEVVVALSVLDRASGGAEAMAALDVPYRPLVTIAEIRELRGTEPAAG